MSSRTWRTRCSSAADAGDNPLPHRHPVSRATRRATVITQLATGLGAPATPDVVDVARVIDDGRMGGYQRLVVFMTAFSVMIDGIDSQLLGIAIPVMMAAWGVSRAAFAPVLAAGFVGMMVGG